MTDVSKELLTCPFCGGEAKHMGGHVRCTNGACPVDVSALTSLDWNTRAQPAPDEPMLTAEEENELVARINANPLLQPAPADVVERVARAILKAGSDRARLALGMQPHDPDDPRLLQDKSWTKYIPEAKAAISAIPVSGEVERLREALRNLLTAVESADSTKRGDFYHERKAARQALTPPRSIRVSDLTDEEVEGMRKPSA